MGYLHIPNLYRDQSILFFRECYALEKIHGTSAHVRWSDSAVHFHSGGEKHERFSALFNTEGLTRVFIDKIGADQMTVYGEAYGGKQQGMSKTYGADLKFVVFDVKVGDCWLSVPQALDVTNRLGLEFVAFEKVPTDVEALDAERDRPSTQAARNGVEGDHIREGVVLRPLLEVTMNNGNRVIAKHKRPEFRERKTIPDIDPSKREILAQADAIADEWVTPMRLSHVLDKLGNPNVMSAVPDVIKAMVEDVVREAADEIVDSKPARKAIGRRAVQLYKAKVMAI